MVRPFYVGAYSRGGYFCEIPYIEGLWYRKSIYMKNPKVPGYLWTG